MTSDRRIPSATTPLQLGVIIPVWNEAKNVPLLLDRFDTVLAGIVWEAIIVDDNSPDSTAEITRARALVDPRVRIIQRIGRRGLSSAVIEGMLASAAPVLAVIDGDLQHDEALLPAFYGAVADDGNDLAVGSRYVADGSTGEWSASRERISRFATMLSRRLLRANLTDPMSGFFAIRRTVVTAALPQLSSVGFKILMDLVASSPTPLTFVELPYTFRNRLHGESKFDMRVAQEFVILLLHKLFGNFLPVRFLMFAIVGTLGLAVHLSVLGSGVAAGLGFRLAQSLAVWVAMTGNFLLNNSFTYRDLRLRGAKLWRGLLSFYAVGAVGAVGNVGVAAIVYRTENIWWLAGLAGAAVGVVWNYAASSVVTWRSKA